MSLNQDCTVFAIALHLALVILVSVPLMRENLRGLKENFKLKIRRLEACSLECLKIHFNEEGSDAAGK